MAHSLLQGRCWEASLSQENSQQEWAHYNAVTCDQVTYWSPAALHPPAFEPISCGQVQFVENKMFGYFHIVTTCVVLLRILKAKSESFQKDILCLFLMKECPAYLESLGIRFSQMVTMWDGAILAGSYSPTRRTSTFPSKDQGIWE